MNDNPILIRKPELILLEALDRIIAVASERAPESEIGYAYRVRLEYIKILANGAIEKIAKQKD